MIRRAKAAFVVIVAAALACGDPSRHLDRANDLRHDRHPNEALREYQDLIGALGSGKLSVKETAIRLKALKAAAEVCHLEIADFRLAISYYHRIIQLSAGTAEAYEARARIGDIYSERMNDHHAAIAQYADIAGSESPDAPRYQLKVAREYLSLKDTDQVRTEARILWERWPQSPYAEDARLLVAQSWMLENRPERALAAYRAVLSQKPRGEIAALALEGQARIYSQRGTSSNLDRATELFTRALEFHPSPETIRMDLASIAKRRESYRTMKPGDRQAVFEQPRTTRNVKVIP